MATYRFLASRVIYFQLVILSFSHTITAVFLSIDCGSSISYKDENGIVWTGDSSYALNGESRSVQSNNSFSHVMDTVRVFTTPRIPMIPTTDSGHLINVYENRTIQVSNNAVLGDSVFLDDRPPPAAAALKNAITTTTPRSSIELYMRFPFSQVPVYINWYFSEVRPLRQSEIRAFRVYKDNQPYSVAILPPHGNCTQLSVSGILASSTNTFSLVPTNYSTLPPLINAMEVFYIGSALTDGTNTKDVRGLASLQDTFGELRDWNGDPCLPAPFSWDWIVCNNNLVPRVTTLSLDGYGLSGLLPDFSSMDALTKIDLSNNKLQGSIPEFLGTLPNLEILVDGNPGVCTTCSTPAKNSSAKRKHKNVLQSLLATILSSIIILNLGRM